MLSNLIAFLLGVFLAPAVRPLFRPVLVEVIRAGMVLSDEVRRMSHTVKEGVEDVQAEAAAARSRESSEPATPTPTPTPAEPAREAGDAAASS